jgi:AhpC/TSA family
MGSVKNITLFVLLLLLSGCGSMKDDLFPSGSDKQPIATPGTIGYLPGQIAPDFTIPDMFGTNVTLSSVITTTGVQGVVLYFTMWCPICWTHMDDMLNVQIPRFPSVRFYAVDYVNGTIADVQQSAINTGYSGTALTILADTQNIVENLYHGTMGITIVIDSTGIIRMNEDYKDGSRLQATLAALP